MIIYHTSPVEITEIHSNGMLEDVLFFDAEPYYRTAVRKPVVYAMHIDNDAIIHVRDLFSERIVAEIAQRTGLDEDVSESLLDGRKSVWNEMPGDDLADIAWWIQLQQARAAQEMGFEAVESVDEQGTVWIVPMLGREHELNKFGIIL